MTDIPELPGQMCLEDVLEPVAPPSDLHFDVDGIPVPQGSKRAFQHRHTGRVVMTDDNPNLEAWRYLVAQAARRAMAGRPPMAGPVTAVVTFYLPRPAGHYGTGRNAGVLKASAPPVPMVKPDLDKLIRAVFDALSAGGAWTDDARCWGVAAFKRYADTREPGASVALNIEPAEPAEPVTTVMRADLDDSAFQYFWDLYPRKVGRPKARAAWDKAVKAGADPSHIAAGASRYASDPNRSEQFTAHPTTWLNRAGWEDDPLPAPATTDRQGSILAREMARARELDALEGNL